ncbi:RCC1 domain-containing protein [Myxococcota bacterium]
MNGDLYWWGFTDGLAWEFVPVQLLNFPASVFVAAGTNHACSVEAASSIWCWGQGANGQIGDGNYFIYNGPSQVIGLSNPIHLGLGDRYTCAVDSIHQAWCWGYNDADQLGTGTLSSVNIPTLVQEY